jgi:hypothetical protein
MLLLVWCGTNCDFDHASLRLQATKPCTMSGVILTKNEHVTDRKNQHAFKLIYSTTFG